jgi:hypothetical protein
MRTRLITTALVAALALTSLPAGADGAISGSAVVDGSTATVSGTALIDAPEGAFSVGGTKTAFAAAGTPIELAGADIELLDDGLRFIWRVEDLPATVPPEGIRYTWSFLAGGKSFQLQAKRTNVASVTTTEDPVGHALQAASTEDWFQLRGACEEMYRGTPTAGCYHLTFLDGEFDPDADTITVDLPFGTRDSIGRAVAETFQRGVEITPNETAGASIAGSFQAVISNNTISSFINGWTPVITGPVVQLGVGRSTANPNTVNYATTADYDLVTGAFSGTVSGVTALNDTVFARVCHGLRTDCVTTKLSRG